MDTKSLRGVEIKAGDKGEVKAVFSTFNEVDHDGDVTLPGFFQDGQEVRLSAYNHASWGDKIPVGKGVIKVTDKEAVFEGQFFMDVPEAASTYKVVKNMADLQEWSYGFDIRSGAATYGEFNGQRVRFLQALEDGTPGGDVTEVSPVLRGAGKSTRTVGVKARSDTERVPAVKRGIPVHETLAVSRSWDAFKTADALPEDARPSQLRTVYAWVDPDADPEMKTSYRLPHHHGIDGPANLRACLAGIADLNSGRADIPDGDRKAVYDHLAAHLIDADREPPKLRDRSAGSSKSPTLNEELVEALAGVFGAFDSASRVVALRREKGKGLSRVNAEVLEWIGDGLKQLDALLSTPIADDDPSDEEIASLIAGSIARIQGI